MEFMTSDGITLNYHDQGTGQSVVLVTGFGGYQEIWKLQVEYLLAMNCRVITFDHRNHGQSQRTNQGLTIQRLTTDLAELIDYLHLQKPILIGHSMGASICYSYLSRYRNVKAVMAIDQSPKMLNDKKWPYGFEDITLDNFAEKVSTPNGVHETLRGLDNRVAFDLNNIRNQFPFQRKESLPLLFDHLQKDWRKTLLQTAVPMSLVAAQQSPYFNCKYVEKISENNSQISQVVLDNCGHDIMAEIPEVFDQTLRHFIFSSLRSKSN